MLQPQLINLVPNLQNSAVKPGRNAMRETGLFGDMLNQGSAALPQGLPGAKGPAKPQAALPNEKQQDLPQEDNIYTFPYLTQPIAEQPDATAELAEKVWVPHPKLQQITQALVSILKGYPNNMPADAEIVPLLEEYARQLAQLEQPLSPKAQELQALLEEVLARTPQNQDIAETMQQVDKLAEFIKMLRGNPSPLENANEDPAELDQTTEEAEIIPLKPTHQGQAQAHTRSGGGEDKAGPKQTEKPPGEINITAQHTRIDIAPPKVYFAEYLASAAEPRFTQLTPDSLFDAMVERIVQLPGAEPRMEISLKPDHLGKISVELTLTDNGLSAKIIANDEGVKNLLAAHINRLSETLAEKGIRVENVEVIYSALADKPFDQRQPGEQQGQNNQNRNGPLWSAHEAVPAGWENAYDMPLYTDEWGDSSVEYRA